MRRFWWQRVVAILSTALLVLAVVLQPADAQVASPGAPLDYPVPGGWFYAQESRAPYDNPPYRGFTVVDDDQAAFWTELRRFGGVNVLGYPVSTRYRYPDANGFLQQAFQRGILQWRADQGHADLVNVFDEFTAQGLDDLLLQEGIPNPEPPTGLPYDDDVALRMSWLTEPQFLARFFYDPVAQQPLDSEDAAFQYLGLPQSRAVRPVYSRDRPEGKDAAPLYLPFVVQRFQKGGLELFLYDEPNDPTIVPGDGKASCVSLTAVGRLARRLGSGRLIPTGALKPQPPDPNPITYITYYVPPAPQGSTVVEFELVGVNFLPGEPVDITMTPNAPPTLQKPIFATTIITRIAATDSDGSFDIVLTGRTVAYTVAVNAEVSHKSLPAGQNQIDLSTPTESPSQSVATYC